MSTQALNIQNLSLFTLIFIIVLIGILVRVVWDEKVKLVYSKVITGALFLSILILAIALYLELKFEFIVVASLVSGLGCENLIKKYIQNKVWDKTDLLDKMNKGDENG